MCVCLRNIYLLHHNTTIPVKTSALTGPLKRQVGASVIVTGEEYADIDTIAQHHIITLHIVSANDL